MERLLNLWDNFADWRWTPVIGILVALVLIVGLIREASYMIGMEPIIGEQFAAEVGASYCQAAHADPEWGAAELRACGARLEQLVTPEEWDELKPTIISVYSEECVPVNLGLCAEIEARYKTLEDDPHLGMLVVARDFVWLRRGLYGD